MSTAMLVFAPYQYKQENPEVDKSNSFKNGNNKR